jgi:hypothetical protein
MAEKIVTPKRLHCISIDIYSLAPRLLDFLAGRATKIEKKEGSNMRGFGVFFAVNEKPPYTVNNPLTVYLSWVNNSGEQIKIIDLPESVIYNEKYLGQRFGFVSEVRDLILSDLKEIEAIEKRTQKKEVK